MAGTATDFCAASGFSARVRCAVLLISGAAAGSCYWPSGSGWLLWAALAPIFWVIEDQPPARAFLWAWLWGLAAWGAALYWFFPVTLQFAAGPVPWRLFLAVGVIAYHALILAIPAAGSRACAAGLAARGWDPRAALALCVVPWFCAAEGLFPQVYPACVATTQFGHLPAVQSLDLAGPGGISWLIFGVNAALYGAARLPRGRGWALAGALAAFGLNEGYGLARLRTVDAQAAAAVSAGRTLSVAVLQGDLPLLKRNTEDSAERNIAFYRELERAALAEGPADLVLWPHNSYERTLRFAADDPGLERPALADGPLPTRLAADLPFQSHTLVSAQASSPESERQAWPSRHYVTMLVGPAGKVVGSTSKVHPTPLAEWLPLDGVFPFLHRLTPKLKRVLPGPSRLLALPDGRRLGVFVCYDAVKTGVARRLAAAGAQVLVNPSSDQWSYDRTSQPWQHLRIVMMRAVENRRFFVRATPSGVSAVVDPAGRLAAHLPVDAAGHFTRSVALLEGRTPFMAVGDAAYWLALFAALGLYAISRTGLSRGRGPA